MASAALDHAAVTTSARARDVMTAKVVTVGADEPVRKVAQLLLDNAISAVPVVSGDGVPIGIVSEGDLLGRDESERLARRDWWLTLVSGGQAVDQELRARLQATARTAGEVMSAPLVTVTKETEASEIARLFAIHHIKRVPVVRDGRLVGIVSRADLLRLVAAGQTDSESPDKEKHHGFLGSLIGEYHLPAEETVAGNMPPEPAAKPPEVRLAADDFRHLVDDFHRGEAESRDATRREAARERRERARQLIDAHISDAGWRQLMHRAREAAECGQPEFMLARFPSQLCIDGGRAINVAEQDWPATLRGAPAEIYLRWQRHLKPQGFGMAARVLDFPDGKPGDVGLFLIWADQQPSIAPPGTA